MITIGAIDGNIIAAIITTQMPTKNPSVPGSVPGPASIPSICSPVIAQATPASTISSPISPIWTSPGSAGSRRIDADSIIAAARWCRRSGGPGELRGGEPGLSLVLDAEGVDARARGPGDGQLGADRMED